MRFGVEKGARSARHTLRLRQAKSEFHEPVTVFFVSLAKINGKTPSMNHYKVSQKII